MKREDLIAVLPCFVCGDLPPQLMETVRKAVETDPELAAMLADLSVSHGTCQEALRRAAPTLLRIDVQRAGADAPRPVSAFWPLILALGVLLALGGLLRQPGPSPSDVVVAQLDAWVTLDPRAMEGFVAGEDASAITAGLRASGAAAPFDRVRDPGVPGLRLVGAAPLAEGGLVVLYVDAQGRAFKCVMVRDRALPVANVELVPGAPEGKPDLRSFAWGGQRAVAWSGQGMLCVLIAPYSRAVVERLAQAKVWGKDA